MATRRILNHIRHRLPSTPTIQWRRLVSSRSSPEAEWFEAQKIKLSVDLTASAKQLLKFLAVIDRNRNLYQGPVLDRAIYRYKYCWLPLLAKQSELGVLEHPLVVPLDCEWIWHIHRLNPVRYKTDCEELYGKILDNSNVESTVQRPCSNKLKETWTRMFLGEPFELDLNDTITKDGGVSNISFRKSTDYDLVAAVKRQNTFYYQVSRPFMSNDIFLREAIARYKGFLHLIKKNKEKYVRRLCVPTYDIDLVWHAHQLHPASYCKGTTAIFGEVLEHDDTEDADRSDGTKLNVEFMETTKQWEKLYGLRYWKVGAMHKGKAPSSLEIDGQPLKEAYTTEITAKESKRLIQLPKKMDTEILMEIVEGRGLPQGQGDEFFVYISQKNQLHKATKKRLRISPESGNKQVVNFRSEPTAELFLELMSSSSATNSWDSAKIIGSSTISLVDLVDFRQELAVDRWFDFFPPSESKDIKQPVRLRISFSFTPPTSATYTLQLISSDDYLNHTSVVDDAGNPIIEIDIRCLGGKPNEVIGISRSFRDIILAKKVGEGWSLMDSQWSFHPQNKLGNVYELLGEKKVIFVPGKKLDYEMMHNSQRDEEKSFFTAVEFSPKNPYGKAVALFDLKSGILKIKEEWFLEPGTISAYCMFNEALGWECETMKDRERRNDDGYCHVVHNKERGDSTTGDGDGDGTEGGDVGAGGCSGSSCGGSCGGGCGGCGG